jgi:type III restriction enzyme
MKFQFDSRQQFQIDAINSVVDLFEGQPSDAASLLTTLSEVESDAEAPQLITLEIGAVGNNLLIDESSILENLKVVQDRNGLDVMPDLVGGQLDFDVEMETGTGKTYVYLRTIFELAKKYNFTKFVILVPSVAIREGVTTSIRLMREHFRELYGIPFDSYVYSGKSADEVQTFATSTSVQILVMTIDSIRGDANNRIIHQSRDRLKGLRPVDYLRATQPVVIMDEPQNMESLLSQSAIGELNPLCTLRYSATHLRQRNVVYRLDPVDAHDLGLVKQIVVAEVAQQGADASPYVKLLEVKREPWIARMELVCRAADGSLSRKVVNVPQHKDLADVSGNEAYSQNWRINEVSLDPPQIELTNHGILRVGESLGGSTDSIFREMIRETVREHLRKELQLRPWGIKVLSLFFVDKVASYLGDGTSNLDANGPFVQWFDEIFEEERAKQADYEALLPNAPDELRRAYFAQIKGKTSSTFVDSSERNTAREDDAYDLIMKAKERLMDLNEPARFIFSHSALREGWDNPNVFQICTLREVGTDVERRQTIGRGLRLPVDQQGKRVSDSGIAQLTVVANESYQSFAKRLQEDYVRVGINIGYVRKAEFSKLSSEPDVDGTQLGSIKSTEIWEHLNRQGYLDKDGKVLGTFVPNEVGFTLNLPEEFVPWEDQIIEVVEKCKVERFLKAQRNRVARKLNKELYSSPEFEEFWHRISRRTTYRVSVDRDDLVRDSVTAILREPPIQPIRVQVTRAGVRLLRGGAKGEELSSRSADLSGSYELPNIIQELQNATSLTRKTVIDILIQSGRLKEFIKNPNDFIAMVKRCILSVLANSVIDGIQYEQITGSVYELRELQKDGAEERNRFIDQMYRVQNTQKTDFDFVVYDSEVEKRFAEKLDSREDIKLFMKLPSRFKIPTPVGDYNPDWAILKSEMGEDKIYMIRETKSTSVDELLRSSERAKIACGTKHFAVLGIDYSKSSPENWNI